MSTSLVLVEFIAVVVSLFVLIFNIIIYKKTAGGSKAYLFWAQAAIFIFSGALIAFVSSFFTNLNEMELEGYKGIISITIKISSRNKEPHSAFSGMIPNPAADLVSLLNTIYS